MRECRECPAWERLGTKSVGECRLTPPTQDPGSGEGHRFPKTREDVWCVSGQGLIAGEPGETVGDK